MIKSNLKEDLKVFNSILNIERQVVGIKFLFTKEELEEFPQQQLERRAAYCTLVRNAGNGKGCKVTLENFSCMAAARALGLTETTQESASGKRHKDLGVYKNLCISRSVAKDMVFCKHQVIGVAIQPLALYESEPDVIIIVTNPFNCYENHTRICVSQWSAKECKGSRNAGDMSGMYLLSL
jgi:uncharacterized protein (DUF169 family)